MLCLYARRSRQQDPVHGRHRVERGPGAYGHWVTDRPDPHGSSAGTARRVAVAQVQQRWGRRWNEAVRISLCSPGKVFPLYWLLPSKVAPTEEKRRCWTTKKQAKTSFHCLQLQECLMPTNKNEMLV